jgi:hypothetical protein
MSDKAALHAIGVKRISPAWLDGEFVHSIDLLPCGVQSGSQSLAEAQTKVVPEINWHARRSRYNSFQRQRSLP